MPKKLNIVTISSVISVILFIALQILYGIIMSTQNHLQFYIYAFFTVMFLLGIAVLIAVSGCIVYAFSRRKSYKGWLANGRKKNK